MAASVESNDSTSLNASIKASREQNEAEASTEKPNLCSDGKDAGDKESCGRIANPDVVTSAVKMSDSESTAQIENIESHDKNGEIFCKTQIIDGSVSHSGCQAGGDISLLKLQAGTDNPRHVLSNPEAVSVKPTGSSSVSCSEKLVAERAEPPLLNEGLDNVLSQEQAAAVKSIKTAYIDSEKQSPVKPELNLENSFSISVVENNAQNTTLPEIMPAHENSEFAAENIHGDNDIQDDSKTPNSKLTDMNPTCDRCELTSEIRHVSGVTENENKTEGTKIPEVKPAVENSELRHETNCGISSVIENENKIQDSVSSEMKSAENEKLELASEIKFGNSITENQNITQESKLPDLMSAAENSEVRSQTSCGSVEMEIETNTQDSKLPEIESAQGKNSEVTSEMNVGDSVIKNQNKTQDSKLPQVKPTNEKSKLTTVISVGDSIIKNQNKTQDSKLSEVKSADEKSEVTSDINVGDNIIENENKADKPEQILEINVGDSIIVTENTAQNSKLREVQPPHEKSELMSEVNVGDSIVENKSKTEDSKLPETKYVQNEKSELISKISVTENKTEDSTLPEKKFVEEKSELALEKSSGGSVSENCNTIEGSKLPEMKPATEKCEINCAFSITEKESKTQDSYVTEINSAQEKSEISADDSVFENNLKQQSMKLPVTMSTQEEPTSTGSELDKVPESVNDKQEQGTSEERPVREMLVRRQRTESTETSIDKPVLETLTFSASKITQNVKDEDSEAESGTEVCVCPLCDRSYPADNKDVLAHLVLMHKFVIADVNFIANLPAYLRYWKARFQEKPVSDFCSKIVTNTGATDQAPKEEFYLLCDALPEDKSIREHLQRKKLESVLAQQQKEREETKFCRQCLFCKQTFCGNRAVLFDHLLRDHTFHVGQPDNLVYTDELFDLIQSKLENQLCLFCEKSFKDKASLREHMRKKQHRKINPKNKEYDRFYIVNYMEMGKNWESLQSEDNRLIKSSERDTDEEEEWSGWNEESESKVVCLFCDSSCVVQTELQQHMKDRHGFDLLEVNNKLQLNFYQKVKLINYIRRQVYHKTCFGCQQVFEDKEKLLAHFDEFSDHIKKIPDSEIWDQPQYFFPTYEDDCLLCHLDDDDEGAAGDALGVLVIAETIPVTDTILKDQKLCRDLLKP